jgi:hypothetical protein
LYISPEKFIDRPVLKKTFFKIKKFFRMNKLFSFLMILGTMTLLGLTASTASATCTVQGPNAAGELLVIEISCDFPLLADTGNPESDQAAYEADLAAWGQANPYDFELFNLLESVNYFNIPQSTFDAMPADRRAAILAKPDFYIVFAE